MNRNSRGLFHWHSLQVFPIVWCVLFEEFRFLEAHIGVVAKTVAHRREFEKIPSSNKVSFIVEFGKAVIGESRMMSGRDSRMLLRLRSGVEQEECRIE